MGLGLVGFAPMIDRCDRDDRPQLIVVGIGVSLSIFDEGQKRTTRSAKEQLDLLNMGYVMLV